MCINRGGVRDFVLGTALQTLINKLHNTVGLGHYSLRGKISYHLIANSREVSKP